MYACLLSHFSLVRLFATLWTVAHEAPLSLGFSRKEYWGRFPCPAPGDLPDSEIAPMSLKSPVLTCGFFTTSTPREAPSVASPKIHLHCPICETRIFPPCRLAKF